MSAVPTPLAFRIEYPVTYNAYGKFLLRARAGQPHIADEQKFAVGATKKEQKVVLCRLKYSTQTDVKTPFAPYLDHSAAGGIKKIRV